ncbi:MAG: hypothetical protein DRI26_07705 [Chloroflexi bacterium]|nr:MAG: hypothetical protein DRI26_07705 [Chloroflexota bacterium]
MPFKIQMHRSLENWLSEHRCYQLKLQKTVKAIGQDPFSYPKIGPTPIRKARLNHKYRILFKINDNTVYILDIVPSDRCSKHFVNGLCKR